MSRPVPFARLFAVGFRQLVDELHDRLRRDGWTDVKPSYGFVLLAARDEPLTARAISALLGVTKQAASQLLDQLERGGYVERSRDPTDGRGKVVALTRRGEDLLVAVEAIYDELDRAWAQRIGGDELERMRSDLTAALVGDDGRLPPVRPVW